MSDDWEEQLYQLLIKHEVSLLPYVPDAGHAALISKADKGDEITTVVLSTEEEGVALNCGAWLGGKKSVLLMQSSGVGNCINMLSLVSNCNFPFVTIVSMRGEWGEFNYWQVPMSRATPGSFDLMGIDVKRCDSPEDVAPTVDAALYAAFASEQKIAILLSQRLIGRKEW